MIFRFATAALLAGLLLFVAGGADAQTHPPHEPFAKWNAETKAEKSLDGLISEVVTMLERDNPEARFDGWSARDIASEYLDLRLIARRTPNAFYAGANFLFRNERFGTFFYARFGVEGIDLFVPSACRARTAPGLRSDMVWFRWEGVPFWTAHSRLSAREKDERIRETMIPTYELSCGNNIKLMLYEGSMLERNDRRKPGSKRSAARKWVGVAIGRVQSGRD